MGIGTGGRSRRHAWRVPLAIAAALVLGAVVFSLANASLETNDRLSSVLAGVIALVGAFVAVLRWLGEGVRPIDHDQEAALLAGALLRRWKPELEHRAGRGDGRTIPLQWRQREDELAAPAAAVLGSDLRVTMRLDGELRGNLDQAATDLAAGFDSVPNHRLVVLGEPGSGKTFLALALTVGLLRSRVAGSRVPVLLSLASWDPVAQSLDAWVVRNLAEDNYAGNTAVPAALLAAGLVLPVLDGLDELPDHVRRRAISRINDTLRGPRPVVLTCRSADYAEVLAAGAPVLLRAPVVQVRPLSPDDIAKHLTTTDNRPDSWDAVVDHVRKNSSSPLTTALSTPLMLSLFTAGFRTTDPAPLLDDPELDNRLAVEDRLVDVLADSMDEGQGRGWLTYLAEQLHKSGTRNLSWWQLATWTLGMAESVVALLAGLVTATGTAVMATVLPATSSIDHIPPWAVGLGTTFAVFSAAVVDSRDSAPVPWAPRVARRRFVRLLAVGTGVVVALGAGLGAMLGIAAALGLSVDAEIQIGTVIGSMVGIAAGAGLVLGVGLGLHGYLAARGHRLAVTTPRELLRHTRNSSLVAAAVVAVVVGVGAVPAVTWGGTAGGHLGRQVALWRGQPVILDRGFPDAPAHVPWVVDRAHLAALVWVSVLVGLVAGGCVLLARPWARFGLARCEAAAFGHLPLRLMAFLERAHEHGLLRVSGGSYQFWHIRMQERLVATAAPEPPPGRLRKAWPAITAGVAAVAAIATLIMIGRAQPPSCPDTGFADLDRVTSRVAARGTSACLGIVPDSTALGLPTRAERPGAATYLVVGEFHRMTARQRAALEPAPPDPSFRIAYIQLADPIPSVNAVPDLVRQLVIAAGAQNPFSLYGVTVLVENGEVRTINW